MLLPTLLACTLGEKPDDSGTTSTEPGPLPESYACLVPEDADPADYTRSIYAIEVFGRVVETGVGEPPGGCRDREAWVGALAIDWDATPTQWVRIHTADDAYWVGAVTNPMVPDPSPLLKQEVTVSYRSILSAPYDGVYPETEMSFDGGGYAFWLGRAPGFDALEPWPEILLSPGDVEVELDDSCGHFVRRSLVAERDGDVRTVPTGETSGFDGIGVWAGGIVENVTMTCSETDRSFVSAFEWTLD